MKLPRSISRTVFLLGIVSLLNDLAGELIMAVLPVFLIGLPGSGGWVIGLIGGFEDATRSLLSLVFGSLADRAGRRKPFLFLGYLIPSIFRMVLPFSTHWGMAMAFRVMDRIGKGMRTAPRDALIADAVTETTRGFNYGFHRAMDTAGALIGSLLALILFWVLGLALYEIILVGGIISLTSLIPLRFVPETFSAPNRQKFLDGLLDLPRDFYLNLGAMIIFAFANFSYMFFLLKVNVSYTDKAAIGLPIAMYTLYNFTYTFLATPAGILSDKIGRRNVLVIGYTIFGLTCLGFAFANDLCLFIPLFALYGIAHAFIESNQRAFAADLAPPQRRATALGLLHMSLGLAGFVGNTIAGLLWGGPEAKHELSFFYGSALTLLGTVALFVSVREREAP